MYVCVRMGDGLGTSTDWEVYKALSGAQEVSWREGAELYDDQVECGGVSDPPWSEVWFAILQEYYEKQNI